jgi:hypothetical protein
MAFRALMAIMAKFDLETVQMDAVNAFVNCDLDEVVYMRPPPGFDTSNGKKVLRLRKALYGLRYTMKVLGTLKWFLGIHVLRDRGKKTLWLSPEAYIEKFAHQFNINMTGR